MSKLSVKREKNIYSRRHFGRCTSVMSLTFSNCIRFAKRSVAGYCVLFLTRSYLTDTYLIGTWPT